MVVIGHTSSIEPENGGWVHLEFTPTDEIDFVDTLNIFSNAGPFSICLEGEGLDTPQIEVNPDPIAITTGCQDSVQTDFYIVNNGNGPLNWIVNYELSEDFESGVLNNELIQFSSGAYSNSCGVNSGNSAHPIPPHPAKTP